MNQTVGISEMKVSNSREDILVTYSLGSCVGLALFDPTTGVGGLVHCMLPLSEIDPAKAQVSPCLFTDTGVFALLEAMFELGAGRENLVAKIAGASSLLDDNGLFKIGERNYTVLRKVLCESGVPVAAEDIGGTQARTLYLFMDTGRTLIRSCGREIEL